MFAIFLLSPTAGSFLFCSFGTLDVDLEKRSAGNLRQTVTIDALRLHKAASSVQAEDEMAKQSLMDDHLL